MKKLLALMLALMLALTCMTAYAETVYAKLIIDPEVAKEVMSGFGIGEDQMAFIDPIFALVNALGVKQAPTLVIIADGNADKYVGVSDIKRYIQSK